MAIRLPKKTIEELDKLVIKLLKGPVEERQQALTRLMDYERSGKVPLSVLLQLADDENPAISMYAISALGRNGEPAAVKALVKHGENSRQGNPLYLETIVDSLALTRSVAAAPFLLSLLGIKSGGLAGRVLGKFSRNKSGDEAQEDQLRRHMTLPAIKALEAISDPKSGELLVPWLEHEDPFVRWHTIKILLNCGLQQCLPRLREIAQQDSNELVREMADIAVGRLSPLPPNLSN